MLSGKLIGSFLTKFFTDVGVLIRFIYLEFGEPLGMLFC
ncbi:hypothetical protein Gotur_027131 [Gossypium turneri]